jgi:hypothetical protein
MAGKVDCPRPALTVNAAARCGCATCSCKLFKTGRWGGGPASNATARGALGRFAGPGGGAGLGPEGDAGRPELSEEEKAALMRKMLGLNSDEDDDDEDGDEDDNEERRRRRTHNRGNSMGGRYVDKTPWPLTLNEMLRNEKAQGSNADLIGEGTEDYAGDPGNRWDTYGKPPPKGKVSRKGTVEDDAEDVTDDDWDSEDAHADDYFEDAHGDERADRLGLDSGGFTDEAFDYLPDNLGRVMKTTPRVSRNAAADAADVAAMTPPTVNELVRAGRRKPRRLVNNAYARGRRRLTGNDVRDMTPPTANEMLRGEF